MFMSKFTQKIQLKSEDERAGHFTSSLEISQKMHPSGKGNVLNKTIHFWGFQPFGIPGCNHGQAHQCRSYGFHKGLIVNRLTTFVHEWLIFLLHMRLTCFKNNVYWTTKISKKILHKLFEIDRKGVEMFRNI